MKHRLTAISAAVLLAACGEAPTGPSAFLDVQPAFNHVPGVPAATSLADDFSGASLNPALEDHDGAFTLANGVIHKTTWFNKDARAYVRTVASGYNDSDFTAEIRVQVNAGQTLQFFGVGDGSPVPPWNEPAGAFFRIHSSWPGWAGGQVDVSAPSGFHGGIAFTGLLGMEHIARIIKDGDDLTFEFDTGADGTVDGSVTVPWPGYTDASSRIFFGGAGSQIVIGGNYFDDLNIVAVPYGNDPETKDDCKKGGWEQYGFKNQGQCVRFIETGKDSR